MDDFWPFIKGFQSVSLCDWPGKISCVIFIGGCNLRCPTCHNKLLVEHPERLPSIPKRELLAYLKKRKLWLDGIVISGGEPTIIDLKHLIKDLKKEVDLPIKIDTNGLIPEVIEELLKEELVDLVAVDLKGPWSKYPQLTGGKCDPEKAKAKLSKIFALAHKQPSKFLFRCTKVPMLDDKDFLIIKSYLPKGFKLKFQEYREPKDIIFMEDNHVH